MAKKPTTEMDLEKDANDFKKAWLHISDELAPFKSNRVVQMIREHGAVVAASRLLAKGEPSKGFAKLIGLGGGIEALKYSLENLVLQYPSLFTPEELSIALKRLKDVGFDPTEDGK